ncbi:MAG: hypothetical protein RIT25_530 [Planctomycetota bacterium]|jgi:hypothetical protein
MNIQALLLKIAGSSTWWVSILLPVLKVLLEKIGVVIPWEVIMAGTGAYGVKEAAAKLQPVVAAKLAEPKS